MNSILSFLLTSVMWVQVPQWEAYWSKCAEDVPDSSFHWYVAAPDNTFEKDLIGKTLLRLTLMDYRM